MNGLDDLRGQRRLAYSAIITDSCRFVGWTLHGAIQSHIDLYVSMNTFKEVQRAFPYLISKEYASGGGDVSGRLTQHNDRLR